VRARPDERGRYVVWDLGVGSYDRRLDQLRRERAGQDPPPLSSQRLLQLVAAVTSDDEADRRLARHDLDQLSDAWQQWDHQLETAVDDDPQYRPWNERYLAAIGKGRHTDGTDAGARGPVARGAVA
jgi:hypothetical protein